MSSRLQIPGTVGPIDIEIRPSPESNTVVFVAHGMGGSLDSSLPRHLATSTELRATVVRFTTSRYLTTPSSGDYAEMCNTFREKVYAQELEDVRRVIGHLLPHQNAKRVVLIGTSMGGISVGILSAEFSVSGVVIVNSGVGFRVGGGVLPDLTKGFPPLEELKNALGKLYEPLLVLRGEHDPIVTLEAAQGLAALAPRGICEEIPGLAHSFTDPRSTPQSGKDLLSRISLFVHQAKESAC